MRLRPLAALASVLLLVAGCGSSAPPPRSSRAGRAASGPVCGVAVAIVVLDEVIAETDERPVMQKKVKTRFEALQKELDVRTEALRRRQESLEKEQKVLAPDAARERAEALQKEYVALQQDYAKSQESLNRYSAQLEEEARERVRNYVRGIAPALAAEYGLLAIYERRAPLWLKEGVDPASPEIRARFDVTDAVIERWNAHPPAGEESI
jgi:Skp family chaperone for outer membrane proteins